MEVKNEITNAVTGGIHSATSISAVWKNIVTGYAARFDFTVTKLSLSCKNNKYVIRHLDGYFMAHVKSTEKIPLVKVVSKIFKYSADQDSLSLIRAQRLSISLCSSFKRKSRSLRNV